MASIDDFKSQQNSQDSNPEDENPEDDSPEDDSPEGSTDEGSTEESTDEGSTDEGSSDEGSTPSMLDRIRQQESPYPTDEAHVVPMLTHNNGIDSGWVMVAHPEHGAFFMDVDFSKDLARNIRDRVVEAFEPVQVSIGKVGEVYKDGVRVGTLQNYRQSELQIGTDNVGNLRFLTEQSGRIVPTNGRYNKHGQRLTNRMMSALNGVVDAEAALAEAEAGLEEAQEDGDTEAIQQANSAVNEAQGRLRNARKLAKGFFHFIGHVFADDVEVDPENLSFTGVTAQGIALENAVVGQESPKIESGDEAFEQLA